MAISEAETQDLIARARAALQRGDKDGARDLLIKLLEQDDRNAKAWLLLSGAVDAVEEQRICLENVLTLEPDNTAARQGLEFLNRMYPPGSDSAPAAPLADVAAFDTAQLPPASPLHNPTEPPLGFAEQPGRSHYSGNGNGAHGGQDQMSLLFPGIEPFSIPDGGAHSSNTNGASAGWPMFGETATPQPETANNWPMFGEASPSAPSNNDWSFLEATAQAQNNNATNWPMFGEDNSANNWGANPALPVDPTPQLIAPDDPWADLRSNMQAPPPADPTPGWSQSDPAPGVSPFSAESVAPKGNENPFGTANGVFPPLPDQAPAMPAWAAGLPAADAPPANLGFGDTPLDTIVPPAPKADTGGLSGKNAAPEPLPDWAISLDGTPAPPKPTPALPWPTVDAIPKPATNGTAPLQFGVSPQMEPPPFGSAFNTNTNQGHAFENSAPFGAASAESLVTDGGSELGAPTFAPDSPWASTFGNGLGAVPLPEAPTEPTGSLTSAMVPSFIDDPNGRGSSPSLISRPPLTGRAVGAAAGFPCPNCGELAQANALSCSRCQFRFYAACPYCGEYLDTTDPSPNGGDTCTKCHEPVDKMKLGRNEAHGLRGMTAREAIVAQIPKTREAAERAADVALQQSRTQSTTHTLVGVLVVLALVLFLLLVLPSILESAGISLQAPDVVTFPTPTS